ncbi:MAG: hypothetical protein C0613_02170 [Desulfobulbaceae bacterium]|nr:MAG: hypothetical protein C0613_02170 [Desulfobulbaceae bacterium]
MHKEISSRTEKSSHNIREDIHQATKAGIGMAAMLTGLAGTWGVCCLVSGLLQGGMTGLITGYLAAITGM